MSLSTAGKLKLELQLVARLNIQEEASPYYPPRARWYSRFLSFGGAIRRRLALDRIRLPREMALIGLVAGFLVPGLAVYIRGPRRWGKAALAGCGLLLLLFIVWFGYPAGNLAFGLLLSIHITGFVYYCSPLLSEACTMLPGSIRRIPVRPSMGEVIRVYSSWVRALSICA